MEAEPSDSPPPPTDPPAAPPGRCDRILLGAFLAYVVLLALAVFGQLSRNRAILDLFDLERYFTR